MDRGVRVRFEGLMSSYVVSSTHPVTHPVTMSYLEIYNENIRDLLNPSSGFLELREDPRGRSIQVAGLSELSTQSTEEVMVLLQKGNRARTVEPTAANRTSSRSHALLSVTVRHATPLAGSERMRTRVRQGRLFMIDLAGSERASQTKNRGKRLQEGAHINRSLLALGNCINALSGGARYVNYRDSKLTRLLKDALSGNCRTVMVAHVSPGARHREESRNTLLYGDRAKNISNKLREEIAPGAPRWKEERPPPSAEAGADCASDHLRLLREQLVPPSSRSSAPRLLRTVKCVQLLPLTVEGEGGGGSGVRDMDLRRDVGPARDTGLITPFFLLTRRLMELDGHLLSLGAEAERQHLLISQWESQNNKLYKNSRSSSKRWMQSRPSTDPDMDTDREWSDGESIDSSLQQAYTELSYIEKEQERYAEMRAETEKNLEECRKQAIKLENELPSQISSDEERELLGLMCRVHELEVEKMALQSERLIKQHELRRRDMVILRFDRQRQLCEEIITRQRQLMEEGCVSLPPDLQELYRLYQREIHAATYNDASPSYNPGFPFSNYTRDKDKLPPITQVSAGSEYGPSPLPPIQDPLGGRPGQLETNPAAAVLFPPIGLSNAPQEHPRSSQTTSHVSRSPSRLPRPRDQHSGRGLRRVASDENLSSEKPARPTVWRY
ncbi:Kinesin-like protein unc-104 [Gryllus bimaculatus]|nr:Kinesin-like protein unc-104 [Gryllus bimaculatus]